MPGLPEVLPIEPLSRPPEVALRVPGSKSITNRALVLSALYARGSCTLRGALACEDTQVMAECLSRLGYEVEADWATGTVRVGRPTDSGLVPASQAELYAANSGTTMRFLTALVALGQGRYRLDGVPRMRQRPIQDLLDALNRLGTRAWSEAGNGCPPVLVEAAGLAGGQVWLKGDVSSQFLSGLLMVAPLARQELEICVHGPLVSQPYVAMTLAMLQSFGVKQQDVTKWSRFRLGAPSAPPPPEYLVEPDASAASYFFAAAAITGGRVMVLDLPYDGLQGDTRFVDLLEQMGCQVDRSPAGIRVTGGRLRGIEADMNAMSDTVMTLAAVACFAEGPTAIRNVAHIRHKESDRLQALATELGRAGAAVELLEDGLIIHPRPLRAAILETYNDHRLAMSLALLGLRTRGIAIRDPSCVGKTYPEFFADLERLRS